MADRLTDTLLALDGVSEVHATELDAVLNGPQAGTLVFVRGEGARRPETADVAVALRELKREFGARIAIAVASARDEHLIKLRLGVAIVPSVVLMRGREVVRNLPRVQDWADYRQAVADLVAEAAA